MIESVCATKSCLDIWFARDNVKTKRESNKDGIGNGRFDEELTRKGERYEESLYRLYSEKSYYFWRAFPIIFSFSLLLDPKFFSLGFMFKEH